MYSTDNPNFYDISDECDATHYLHTLIHGILDSKSDNKDELLGIYCLRKNDLIRRRLYNDNFSIMQ